MAGSLKQRRRPTGTSELGEKTDSQPGLRRTFFDTNILLYAEDSKDERKRRIALDLVLAHKRQRTGVVSLQVLQEFYTNAIQKLSLDPAIARYKVEFHSRFHVVESAADDVLSAIDLHRLHRISFWDAMILHCARKSGCSTLLTEDLQNGRSIDRVRIVNPFV